ncbi:class I SAM-dependent methyltransferase [Streptomyces sp. NPDC005794]|uniref:class I SAM-dependent methyltransferase n=1 Tax=Streptomyces sp. NPDC005794 TaxID=3364733 RepID=UPI0036CDFCF2
MEQRDVQGHYEQLAAEYDEHWVYGPDYIRWMAARIAEALRLTADDRMADIGCGTGLFARKVANQVRPGHPVLCADPSEAMLRQIGVPPPPDLTPVVASAEDIAEGTIDLPLGQLDAMWLKESVHHLADPARTLRGLVSRLAPGGRLLVVMLPATIRYPLFKAALTRFEELQPDPADIAEHLSAAGMEAELVHVEHELCIDRDKYFGMVRARYMSLLSTFSDAEIDEGIEEMAAAHPGPVLTFPDRFAFVRGQLGTLRGEGT